MTEYAENLLVHFRRIENIRNTALEYPSVELGARQLSELELLLNRAYYPLNGYLNRDDYESVLSKMRLKDGSLWPMPVCLDIDEAVASCLKPGDHLALLDQEGFMLAVLRVDDVWQPDLRLEARSVFGTDDPKEHAGVERFLRRTRDWYVGGSLEGLHLPMHYDFRELRLTPADTHRQFSVNGWRNVLGLHVDRYIHRNYREMAFAAAREAGANILLHPTVDMKHPGDLDHFSQVCSYREIASRFPRNMVMLGLVTLPAKLAGPREALLQAMVRKNYGCSHFGVESGHADPMASMATEERFYPRLAAQELVKAHEEETGISMVPLEEMFYVEERAEYIPKGSIGPEMTVKHITSSELVRRLENGLEIPEWFSYPEVVEQLKRVHPSKSEQGFTIFMTGLSGSGKSTLAKVLMVKFMEMRGRPVTLLDGDIVRKNLSSELDFSRKHRDLNITRIGFVASEITKNGGIAICAPIAPYEEPRRHNRELISRYGGYIEVYMATPLEVCEQRDRKGLYAKARAGSVKGVTGVSDPYIPPKNPEITIDTTAMSPEEAAQEVLLYLDEEGYLK